MSQSTEPCGTPEITVVGSLYSKQIFYPLEGTSTNTIVGNFTA